MSKSSKIRVLALGLIQNGDRIFVSQGYDPIKKQTFYRALGGGVDFGELSFNALKREFQEEIQAELTNIHYLGCLENIFVYDKKIQHELIQLYRCDFVDIKFYQLEELEFVEKKRSKKALWVSLEDFKSGKLVLFPKQFLQYCD
ncbi:NUDIX hydrolase [Planktothrix pseudagardhii]|uniref:NUDIX hydrolase n=1 Tax=Planktothrix pseudagardhii TaxID=132604 RepID=A0A9W4CQX4_9CYAN|nr:NUDIX domain-containing protein [Planktothrix pseudagardhii]CAD5951426.1 NUDIX hydrolase [Planktothrix pseudagardhii]